MTRQAIATGRKNMLLSGLLLTGSIMVVIPLARAQAEGGAPVRLIVTAEPHHGHDELPVLHREDVRVTADKQTRPVLSWVPLQGDRASLQLFVLLDDSADTDLGTQFPDLKKFISDQPATTEIAIGYMRNGTVMRTQEFTADHARAAQAIRLPLGSPGVNGSPYFSLVDLIKHWPASNSRREILLISDGVERYSGSFDLNNLYVNAAVEEAQRAGVVVYAIYYGGAGHSGHSLYQVNWGQTYLSQLADQTGGEAYFQGLSSPVSLTPFLNDIAERLSHQFLLSFKIDSEKKGSLVPVKLSTEVPHVDLVSASRVSSAGTGAQ